MQTKNACPHCGTLIPLSESVNSKKLGLPFFKCAKCGEMVKSSARKEFMAVYPSGGATYFMSAGVFFISLIFSAAIAAILYFTVGKFFALLAILVLPILVLIILQVKRVNNLDEILKSKKRCAIKGYLDFLTDNGYKIDAKKKSKASDTIEYAEAENLFKDLLKSDKFLSHFPTAFALACKDKQNKELLQEMKKEVKDTLTEVKPDTTSVKNIDIPDIENSDIGSIEKYIKMILTKYNLRCTEGRFQNIKIDVITYLEEHDEPERNAIKAVIFNALKER